MIHGLHSEDIITSGHAKHPRVGKTVEDETDHLGFEYVEVPTPQQRDTSSCGPMVIRNTKLRMTGFSVGSWDDRLDAERLRLEIVEAFKACISDGAVC